MQPTQAHQGHSFMQQDTDQQERVKKEEVEESGKKCVGVDLPKQLPFMSGHKSLQAYMEILHANQTGFSLDALAEWRRSLGFVHLKCHSSQSVLNISVKLRLRAGF